MERLSTISRSQRSSRSHLSRQTVPKVTPASKISFKESPSVSSKASKSKSSRLSSKLKNSPSFQLKSPMKMDTSGDDSSIDSTPSLESSNKSSHQLHLAPCPKELEEIPKWIFQHFKDFVKMDPHVLNKLFKDVYAVFAGVEHAVEQLRAVLPPARAVDATAVFEALSRPCLGPDGKDDGVTLGQRWYRALSAVDTLFEAVGRDNTGAGSGLASHLVDARKCIALTRKIYAELGMGR